MLGAEPRSGLATEELSMVYPEPRPGHMFNSTSETCCTFSVYAISCGLAAMGGTELNIWRI